MTSRLHHRKNTHHDIDHNHKPNVLVWILTAFVLGVMAAAINMTSNYVWFWSCAALLIMLFVWMMAHRSLYAHQIIWGGLSVCVVFSLGLAEAKYAMSHVLRDRLQTPQTVNAVVRVIGMSDGVDENWRQVVERVHDIDGLPKRWLLYPKFAVNVEQRRPIANLRAGELWQVTVKLSPPHGLASPAAFDQEQWLLTERIGATGSLESAVLVDANAGGLRGLLDHVDRYRNELRDHLAQLDSPARAVLLGLMTGDRALIDPDVRQLYQQAGISHLMAISGPHVV
ncbi:MAG: ComEC/Rec2 family competence protein, partial [Candidatus Saccharibacteria bacterium]|nr:ComEC/Rec2 family competence protein [Moraxellaceae bacterium]